jgi:hypothetical protein
MNTQTLRDKIYGLLVELYTRGFAEGQIGMVQGSKSVEDKTDEVMYLMLKEMRKCINPCPPPKEDGDDPDYYWWKKGYEFACSEILETIKEYEIH